MTGFCVFGLYTLVECDLGERSTVCAWFEAVEENLSKVVFLLYVFMCFVAYFKLSVEEANCPF